MSQLSIVNLSHFVDKTIYNFLKDNHFCLMFQYESMTTEKGKRKDEILFNLKCTISFHYKLITKQGRF